MTSTFEDFTSYRDRTGSNTDLFLGRLCWYTISQDSYLDHSDFCRRLMELDLTQLPGRPRPSDVFKRSCTANVRNRVPTADPNVFRNFLIREVGKDSNTIWRTIVEETVDNEDHKLDYIEVFSITFVRTSETIIEKPLVDRPSQEAKDIVAGIRKSYEFLNNLVTPWTIRDVLRRSFSGVQAVLVRPSGGVYFVQEKHGETVNAMDTLINELPGGSSFHFLPLVDDRKQRLMLKQAFEDESVGQVDSLIGEMSDLLRKDKKISSDQFATFKVQHDKLLSKVAEYSDLLDDAMEQTASRLEIMDEVMFALLGKVKV